MMGIPVGIQDFKAVRDGNRYFVDKSMLIGQIIDQNDRGVFLYTRPRRFGKSTNLSMIDAFFNQEYKGNKWFDDLEISKHREYDAYKNSFPVIAVSLDFNNIIDFDKFIDDYNSKLFDVFGHFLYLEDSTKLSPVFKSLFHRLLDGEKSITDSEQALTKLCSMLEMHHGSKVVVLIDEYDSVMNAIEDVELRRRVVSFMRGALSPLLKGNSSLQMGVLTGVMQIAKESIFSGLNNIYVNNVFSERYDEMFGFTDGEVRRICADYGCPEKFEEAKDWYDGYRFGNADIYNPWSILNYIDEGFRPRSYWVNTSDNRIIVRLLERADDQVFDTLKMLSLGEFIVANVKTTVTFDDILSNPDYIYSFMVVSGYLKAVSVDGGYLLSIPNKELYSVFAEMVFAHAYGVEGPSKNLRMFCDSVLENDTVKMEASLYGVLTDTVSSRVLNDEHSYQAFITGLLMAMFGRYLVTADFESGKGYYDIRMEEKKGGSGPNVVIELKRSESEGSLHSDAEGALCQIKERDYTHGLKGRSILYGVSFFGKVPHVVSEILDS